MPRGVARRIARTGAITEQKNRRTTARGGCESVRAGSGPIISVARLRALRRISDTPQRRFCRALTECDIRKPSKKSSSRRSSCVPDPSERRQSPTDLSRGLTVCNPLSLNLDSILRLGFIMGWLSTEPCPALSTGRAELRGCLEEALCRDNGTSVPRNCLLAVRDTVGCESLPRTFRLGVDLRLVSRRALTETPLQLSDVLRGSDGTPL